MRTDTELKQIAFDIVEDKIFHSELIDVSGGKQLDLGMTFLPLMFMSEKDQEEFLEAKPVLLFEYYDKATNRANNGYPTFISMNFLIKEECDAVNAYMHKINEMKKSI